MAVKVVATLSLSKTQRRAHCVSQRCNK